MNVPAGSQPTRIDRYELGDVIASGGMATVHVGRLLGPARFGKTVAIKRLHAHLAREPEFVAMLTDEARVTGRIGHPNLVPTLDIVTAEGEVFLVMEYVPGLTLASLLAHAKAEQEPMPAAVACGIACDILRGLDAAHEARDEAGHDLGVVHRDVSPQNILVGADGVARLLDFGIAKAAGRLHTTREGQLKGKVGYMSPEQLAGREVDRRTDIYALSVVLWEAIAGERLFDGADVAVIFGGVMQKKVPAPSTRAKGVASALDDLILTGLEREPSRRPVRARDMAIAIERALPVARASEIGEWVALVGERELTERARRVGSFERRGAAARALAPTSESTDGVAPLVTEAPPRSMTRWRAGPAVGAALVAAALFGWGVVRLSREAPAVSAVGAGGPSRESAPVAPTDVAPTVPSGRDVDPPVAPEPQSQKTLLRLATSTPRTRVLPRPPPKAPAKTEICDPPFTIDAQGHKHYKVDCL
jgi:serine/threonine-protein kinase